MKTKTDAIIELTKAGWTSAEIKQALGDDGNQAEPVIMPPVQPVQPVPYAPWWDHPWWQPLPPRQWYEITPYVPTITGNTSGPYYSYIGDEQ